MKEIWKSVPGVEYCEASNLGNARITERVVVGGCRLKGKTCIKKYSGKMLGQSKKGLYAMVRVGYKNYKVHRLVALAFLDNPNNYPFINHIDGDKRNNRLENLEWCSQKQNVQHAIRIGLWPKRSLTHKQRQEIRERNYKKVVDTKTGEVFKSISDAAAFHKIPLSTLSMMINGKIRNKTSLKIAT